MSRIVYAKKPAPLLSVPDFVGAFGRTDPPKELEMIALPGTKFEVLRETSSILEVKTQDYPIFPLYIDARFTSNSLPERMKTLPSKDAIIEKLLSLQGYPYIWGGNWSAGIPEIATYYRGENTLKGVDCSGLLYEATEGFTPRNTGELLHFGREIPTLSDVKPLDIIVWPGHVIIALDRATSIESASGRGVIIAPLHERLPSTSFVIRRFN